MFNGVYTALITPFLSDRKIDFAALDRLIDFQIDNGVAGLVLLGTTAETATLSDDEQKEIVEAAVKKINGRVPVIIGVGSNDTEKTYKTAAYFAKYNPMAFLVVTPYYNKPNMSGLVAHFKRVAELNVPIVLYHIPGRTGLKVSPANMEKLVDAVPMIKGIKESDYDIASVTENAVRLRGKAELICGNDDLFLQFMSLGSKSIISAACNVLSKEFVAMHKSENAFDIFAKTYPLITACYLETNPVCSKYMLYKMGLCAEAARLPLGPLSEENKQKIDALLKK